MAAARAGAASGGDTRRAGSVLGPAAGVREQVQSLAKINSSLEKLVARIGSANDNEELRQKITRQRQDATELCMQIMKGLADASDANPDVRKKLTREFGEQFDKFKRISREHEDKDKEYVLAKSAQQPDAEVHNEDDEERALNVQFQAYDLESIRERQQGIQQIERNVTELSDMFQDLQMLVAQQQESLDTIESNIQATKDETDRGLGELQEAEKLQRSARKRQCCILFIVLTILAVFVTIGVCASRHC